MRSEAESFFVYHKLVKSITELISSVVNLWDFRLSNLNLSKSVQKEGRPSGVMDMCVNMFTAKFCISSCPEFLPTAGQRALQPPRNTLNLNNLR